MSVILKDTKIHNILQDTDQRKHQNTELSSKNSPVKQTRLGYYPM
jgi:hypothetical protein